MTNKQTEAMLSDILAMLSEQEKLGNVDGPMVICLYELTQSIVHEHIHAANRNQPIPTPQ